jgi:hypothetical protein
LGTGDGQLALLEQDPHASAGHPNPMWVTSNSPARSNSSVMAVTISADKPVTRLMPSTVVAPPAMAVFTAVAGPLM